MQNTATSFWARVASPTETGCREWAGARSQKGYGKVRWNGRDAMAHRVAWALTNGEIGAALCVCHQCDNPPCCNPGPHRECHGATSNAAGYPSRAQFERE